MKTTMKTTATVLILSVLAACGTTYDVPEVSQSSVATARAMFAAERQPDAINRPRLGAAAAVDQFARVVARLEPVAEDFCRSQTADRPDFDCDINIVVDRQMPVRNAYQTYGPNGEIIVALSVPMIADARNADEMAFVIAHEVGHHVGRHIEKAGQQALAGALIMGALTAYGQASATAANPYRYTGGDQAQMRDAVRAGAMVGDMAYSQTYELEADVIGTYIAASAGYDPVVGARFFARPEAARTPQGSRSFWGTHPPNEARLATVIQTAEAIASAVGR